MVTNVVMETFVIIVLFLIPKSTLEQSSENVTGIFQNALLAPQDGDRDRNYQDYQKLSGTLSKDYYKKTKNNLKTGPVNVKEGENSDSRNNTTNDSLLEINRQVIDLNKTVNNSENDWGEYNMSETITKPQVNYSNALHRAINSSKPSSFVEAGMGVKELKGLVNDAQKDNLKLLNGTIDNKSGGCDGGNTSSSTCHNTTSFNETASRETDPTNNLETSENVVPSGNSSDSGQFPSTVPRNFSKVDKSLSEQYYDKDEITTEANVLTQLLKDNQNSDGDKRPEEETNKTDKSEGEISDDQILNSKNNTKANDVISNNDVELFTSNTSGYMTSTTTYNFSSIILSAESLLDSKSTSVKKSSSKGAIPDFTKSNGYPPHAIHGLIWEDRRYLLSVLIPVGCGILGALTMVSLAYAARNCRSRYSYHIPSMPTTPEEVGYMDKIMLIPDSSDDEV